LQKQGAGGYAFFILQKGKLRMIAKSFGEVAGMLGENSSAAEEDQEYGQERTH
jgi:hypothetical protein